MKNKVKKSTDRIYFMSFLKNGVTAIMRNWSRMATPRNPAPIFGRTPRRLTKGRNTPARQTPPPGGNASLFSGRVSCGDAAEVDLQPLPGAGTLPVGGRTSASVTGEAPQPPEARAAAHSRRRRSISCSGKRY